MKVMRAMVEVQIYCVHLNIINTATGSETYDTGFWTSSLFSSDVYKGKLLSHSMFRRSLTELLDLLTNGYIARTLIIEAFNDCDISPRTVGAKTLIGDLFTQPTATCEE